MNNVINFPSQITAADQRAAFAQSVVEKVRTQYAAMPASITANATLNRALTDLQKNGWKITSLKPEIIVAQPNTGEEMGIVDAVRRQRQIEWVCG